MIGFYLGKLAYFRSVQEPLLTFHVQYLFGIYPYFSHDLNDRMQRDEEVRLPF